jgi:hypothetical protein
MANIAEPRATEVPALMTTIEAEGISDITGRPNHSLLMNMINELSYAAGNIECPYTNFGYMHLVIPGNLYLDLTGKNFNLPADLGDMPPYMQNADATANHAILLQRQCRKLIYNNMKNMIPRHTFIGNIARTLLDWFDNLARRYGRPTPHKHTANLN